MRLSLAATLIAASVSAGSAFVTTSKWGVSKTVVFSTVETESSAETTVQVAAAPVEIDEAAIMGGAQTQEGEIVPLTADEINARRNAQLEKLSQKDATSKQLSKEVGSPK